MKRVGVLVALCASLTAVSWAVTACTQAANTRQEAAWTTTYKYGLSAPAETALGYGIVSIKRELYYNGFGKNLVLSTPYFGDAAANRTREFEKAKGLYVDGKVGPTVARVLFRKRALNQEALNGIPDHLLAELKTLESANDPAATGYVDPGDHGLMQIHMAFHPDISDAQAFDPAFSVPWGARYLTSADAQLDDWDAAVASYNVGAYYAGLWLQAGKPTSGMMLGNTDIFATAYHYVHLVRSAQW